MFSSMKQHPSTKGGASRADKGSFSSNASVRAPVTTETPPRGSSCAPVSPAAAIAGPSPSGDSPIGVATPALATSPRLVPAFGIFETTWVPPLNTPLEDRALGVGIGQGQVIPRVQGGQQEQQGQQGPLYPLPPPPPPLIAVAADGSGAHDAPQVLFCINCKEQHPGNESQNALKACPAPFQAYLTPVGTPPSGTRALDPAAFGDDQPTQRYQLHDNGCCAPNEDNTRWQPIVKGRCRGKNHRKGPGPAYVPPPRAPPPAPLNVPPRQNATAGGSSSSKQSTPTALDMDSLWSSSFTQDELHAIILALAQAKTPDDPLGRHHPSAKAHPPPSPIQMARLPRLPSSQGSPSGSSPALEAQDSAYIREWAKKLAEEEEEDESSFWDFHGSESASSFRPGSGNASLGDKDLANDDPSSSSSQAGPSNWCAPRNETSPSNAAGPSNWCKARPASPTCGRSIVFDTIRCGAQSIDDNANNDNDQYKDDDKELDIIDANAMLVERIAALALTLDGTCGFNKEVEPTRRMVIDEGVYEVNIVDKKGKAKSKCQDDVIAGDDQDLAVVVVDDCVDAQGVNVTPIATAAATSEKLPSKVSKTKTWIERAIDRLGMSDPVQRLGKSFFIGLIPVLGPIFCLYLSYSKINRPLATSLRIGQQAIKKLRRAMMKVMAVDFLVGLIPFLGPWLKSCMKGANLTMLDLAKEFNKKHTEICMQCFFRMRARALNAQMFPPGDGDFGELMDELMAEPENFVPREVTPSEAAAALAAMGDRSDDDKKYDEEAEWEYIQKQRKRVLLPLLHVMIRELLSEMQQAHLEEDHDHGHHAELRDLYICECGPHPSNVASGSTSKDSPSEIDSVLAVPASPFEEYREEMDGSEKGAAFLANVIASRKEKRRMKRVLNTGKILRTYRGPQSEDRRLTPVAPDEDMQQMKEQDRILEKRIEFFDEKAPHHWDFFYLDSSTKAIGCHPPKKSVVQVCTEKIKKVLHLDGATTATGSNSGKGACPVTSVVPPPGSKAFGKMPITDLVAASLAFASTPSTESRNFTPSTHTPAPFTSPPRSFLSSRTPSLRSSSAPPPSNAPCPARSIDVTSQTHEVSTLALPSPLLRGPPSIASTDSTSYSVVNIPIMAPADYFYGPGGPQVADTSDLARPIPPWIMQEPGSGVGVGASSAMVRPCTRNTHQPRVFRDMTLQQSAPPSRKLPFQGEDGIDQQEEGTATVPQQTPSPVTTAAAALLGLSDAATTTVTPTTDIMTASSSMTVPPLMLQEPENLADDGTQPLGPTLGYRNSGSRIGTNRAYRPPAVAVERIQQPARNSGWMKPIPTVLESALSVARTAERLNRDVYFASSDYSPDAQPQIAETVVVQGQAQEMSSSFGPRDFGNTVHRPDTLGLSISPSTFHERNRSLSWLDYEEDSQAAEEEERAASKRRRAPPRSDSIDSLGKLGHRPFGPQPAFKFRPSSDSEDESDECEEEVDKEKAVQDNHLHSCTNCTSNGVCPGRNQGTGNQERGRSPLHHLCRLSSITSRLSAGAAVPSTEASGSSSGSTPTVRTSCLYFDQDDVPFMYDVPPRLSDGPLKVRNPGAEVMDYSNPVSDQESSSRPLGSHRRPIPWRSTSSSFSSSSSSDESSIGHKADNEARLRHGFPRSSTTPPPPKHPPVNASGSVPAARASSAAQPVRNSSLAKMTAIRMFNSFRDRWQSKRTRQQEPTLIVAMDNSTQVHPATVVPELESRSADMPSGAIGSSSGAYYSQQNPREHQPGPPWPVGVVHSNSSSNDSSPPASDDAYVQRIVRNTFTDTRNDRHSKRPLRGSHGSAQAASTSLPELSYCPPAARRSDTPIPPPESNAPRYWAQSSGVVVGNSNSRSALCAPFVPRESNSPILNSRFLPPENVGSSLPLGYSYSAGAPPPYQGHQNQWQYQQRHQPLDQQRQQRRPPRNLVTNTRQPSTAAENINNNNNLNHHSSSGNSTRNRLRRRSAIDDIRHAHIVQLALNLNTQGTASQTEQIDSLPDYDSDAVAAMPPNPFVVQAQRDHERSRAQEQERIAQRAVKAEEEAIQSLYRCHQQQVLREQTVQQQGQQQVVPQAQVQHPLLHQHPQYHQMRYALQLHREQHGDRAAEDLPILNTNADDDDEEELNPSVLDYPLRYVLRQERRRTAATRAHQQVKDDYTLLHHRQRHLTEQQVQSVERDRREHVRELERLVAAQEVQAEATTRVIAAYARIQGTQDIDLLDFVFPATGASTGWYASRPEPAVQQPVIVRPTPIRPSVSGQVSSGASTLSLAVPQHPQHVGQWSGDSDTLLEADSDQSMSRQEDDTPEQGNQVVPSSVNTEGSASTSTNHPSQIVGRSRVRSQVPVMAQDEDFACECGEDSEDDEDCECPCHDMDDDDEEEEEEDEDHEPEDANQDDEDDDDDDEDDDNYRPQVQESLFTRFAREHDQRVSHQQRHPHRHHHRHQHLSDAVPEHFNQHTNNNSTTVEGRIHKSVAMRVRCHHDYTGHVPVKRMEVVRAGEEEEEGEEGTASKMNEEGFPKVEVYDVLVRPRSTDF